MGAHWGAWSPRGAHGTAGGGCHCWGSGIRITGDQDYRGQAVTSTSWAGAQQHLPLLQGVRAGEASNCSTSRGESRSCPPA